ncbi:MAG: 6-phosphogluconolactonase, partial [Clostridia bacterium]|nr:6-phosphogluconolactonase [Clostridia bacterium]
MILKSMKKDELKVFVHDGRESMGKQVAADFADYVRKALETKKTLNVIFAAAPSQNDFLKSLEKEKGVDWKRVNAFHMDEYIGIGIDDEQSFARFVKENVVKRLGIENFFAINGKAEDIEKECARYTELLRKYKVDAVCLGIGENGHIAFNDPWVADFWDDRDVK